MITLSNILLYVVALTNFLLAFVVLKGSRKTENKLFAVFLFAAIFWAVGDALMLYSNTYFVAHTGVVMFYAAPLITTLFVVYFTMAFPNNKPLKPGMVLALALPTTAYLVATLFFPDTFLKSLEIVPYGQNIITHHKDAYKIYALYFNIYFLLSYIFLIIAYKKSNRRDKKRVSYALWSILITSFAALFTNLTMPILGKNQYVFAGPIFLLFFAVVVTLGIVRQRLFDIRFVVARSIAYLMSIFVLALFYGLIAFTLIDTLIFNPSTTLVAKQTVYTLLAVTLAFTFQPLRRFFDKWSNSFFYRDAYDSQELLDNLNKVLLSTVDLNRLLRSSAEVINQSIKAEYIVFGIKEIGDSPQRITGTADKKFSKDDIELVRQVTPKLRNKSIIVDSLGDESIKLRQLLQKNQIAVLIRLTDTPNKIQEGLGYIVVGVKKSGASYTRQDIKALEIIADGLVIAIQNSLRFEEIQNFNTTLQSKVNQATRRLREVNARLVELDQTKDDFISMASHQLRTPLTSVKGYISMVVEGDAGKVTKKQAELLNQAFLGAQRMVYLISDLLNVSRLRTGKFIIESKATNLAEIIESELGMLKEAAHARGLSLIYDKPTNFPSLMLDETKIRQVIMNFTDNAIYYTPSGGNVEIKLQDTGEAVEFTVVDDGIGVPKAEQHHLFSKFYRAGNAKRVRPDGTGLGLFMAKKVVAAHKGGSLIFKSQEGKGSTFGFRFIKQRLLP